jgi:hypothetical protein
MRPPRLLSAALLLFATAAVARPDEGLYARKAQLVWHHIAGLPHSLVRRSPDGRTRVVARYDEDRDDGRVTLTISGRMGRGTVDIGAGVGSEILWAPDSRRFAVTTSDNGGNGIYRTKIVAPGRGETVKIDDLTPIVRRAFGHPVWCHWPEPPNVGAIRWDGGSDRLIVAAEIVSHSVCDSMGTFRAYAIDLRHRRIVAQFSQIEAKRRFRDDLGMELRGASDECVRHPGRCRVAR